ncbi:MAG TPA: hypothetical protein PLN78_07285, partial [Pseudomonadales bacterium]|nr:hypothetical protein [Pseudomonadales bacterium]
WGSGVEIPAQDQAFYASRNVPHGQLRQVLYHSRSTDAVLRCFVYTPPDYDQDPARRYPVLYLQHGGGEDETGWGNQGRAGLIMVAHGEEMLKQFCTAGILLHGGHAQWFDRIGDALAAYKESLQA